MKSIAAVCAAWVLAALTATAQQFPPPEEMKSFDALLGSWEGGGTMYAGPEDEGFEWTGWIRARKVLGGHVVEEDVRIDSAMGSMLMRSLYGWDGERGVPWVVSFGNVGGTVDTQLRWVDGSTLVGVIAGVAGDQPFCNRWTSRVDGDTYSFTVDYLTGTGPFYRHATGELKRSDRAFSFDSEELESPFPPAEEMEDLEGLVGAWKLSGTVIPFPGMPAMEVGGSEEMSWMFGGAVLSSPYRGDPIEGFPDFEGHTYIFWDAARECYQRVWADNMGQLTVLETRWAGPRELVGTSSRLMFGAPTVERTVLELDGEGRPARTYADRISGSGEAVRMFEGTYSPAAETAAAPAFREGSCCARAAADGVDCPHPCCVAAAADGEVCAGCNG